MLVKEPERRISIPEIVAHPWFQKVGGPQRGAAVQHSTAQRGAAQRGAA